MRFNDSLKGVIMETNIEALKKLAQANGFNPNNTRVGLVKDAAKKPMPALDVKAALVGAGMKPDDPLLRDIMASAAGAYDAATRQVQVPDDEREKEAQRQAQRLKMKGGVIRKSREELYRLRRAQSKKA